jgi:mitogen-activated protein kinase kinase 7
MNDFDLICAIGNGTCGEVSKMKHKPTGRVLAVKVSEYGNYVLVQPTGSRNTLIKKCVSFQKMCQSFNAEEQKRIVMDLDVVLKSHDCPYIVACLGAYISEV